MVQRDRRSLVFKILTVTLFLILLVGNACLGQPITRAPGPTTIFPGPSTQQTIVLNLLHGQQYFGVPHVYMGYYGFFPANVTTQWPAYYSPLNASQYWSLAGISSNQPVLELLGAALESSGAMYWPTYYEGGNITISFITVYTAVNSTILGNLPNPTSAYLYTSPISVYLFIKPLGWGISSMYNFSIPCARPLAFVIINSTYGFSPIVPMIPEGTANYLIVTWFPTNQYQWTIEVVNTTSTYSLTLTYLGGNGSVEPKPGDLLNVTITYNPNTNTIYGMIRDLNTSETSTFTASLNGNFTPPSSGYYVFGIGTASNWEMHCGTACCSCTAPIPFQANWALLYAAVSQQLTTPPTPSSSSLAVQVFSALGRLATTVPGVVYGVLYNSSGFGEVAFMNSSGFLNFNNIAPGTYTLEVYHYPNTGLNLTEYWGSETINVQPGNNVVNFTRNEPWIYNLQASVSNGEIVVTVTVNGTVTSPTQGEIELWVTNNPSLASPYSPSNVTYVTINPGLNTFNLTYPVSQAGTYYVYAALLTYNNTYTVTDQWNWTLIISPKGSLTFYVPVWYNGTTYYVYWSVKGISVTSTEGNVISSTIGVSPNQFLQLFLQLNSSHAIMKFEGITYQNGTPITNTAQEELILGYLYLWLLLGSNWKTVVQNYGTTSAGYQFLNVTIQSGIPTVIETANGITNTMYYLLDFLEVVEGLIEGNNHISVLTKVTVTFFKVLKLYSSHNLQDEFGNQKAQEIEELFKQYGLQASNYFELLQEFSSLPPSEQENLIASLYEITTGQTLPNPTLKAADILINRIISEGVSILVKSFADSLYESLINQGVDQYFASLVLQNFESDLQDEISDSILSSEGLTSFLLLTVADIIENAWNIPNEVVYSVILALINNLNYNYEYIENYINAYETSNVANLTLASQLYSAMILNNLWWSEMWHNFYILPRPPWLHPNNDYLLYSNEDYINAIDMILVLSNLMGDASFTLKWGYISPIFILDQNIYTPIVPQYSSSWNSFLEHLISLK